MKQTLFFNGAAARSLLLCASITAISQSSGQDGVIGGGITAQNLAQRAMILVRDQITEATGRESGTTWATQPGAVSVFSSTGRPRSLYKLYSAPQMVASSVEELSGDVPGDWDVQPGRNVDLNAPVAGGGGGGLYFPIADPRADAEGFSYEAAVSGVVPGRRDDARLPMPVTWLYVLADGNEGYLDRNNRFVGSVTPTEDNPIVGRYGFWTDDNTSRINVNTASEGVYWDTPRVNTEEDRAYGRFQPALGEYQRYPGHPAKVSMSSVLFPDRRYRLPGTASQLGLLSLDETKAIWKAARGISDGGSEGGTKVIDIEITTSIAPAPEAIMPYRDAMQVAAGLPTEAAERVAKGRFFLTTESRSADANLHGYPRLSTWPISDTSRPSNVSNRSPFDHAIAAVSTIDNSQYFVQREDAYSRHHEFYGSSAGRNASVYDYLQAMTDAPVPGFGSSFGAKYGAGRFDDRDQILAQSLGYIRGTNLFDGSNRRWHYTVGGNGKNADRVTGHGQINPFCLCGGSADHDHRWYNERLQPSLGMGRMIGLSEIAVMLVVRAETKLPDEDGNVAFLGDLEDLAKFDLWDAATNQPLPGKKLVQMGILVEAFAPAHGFTYLQPLNGISIGSGDGNADFDLPQTFTLNGKTLKRGRVNDKEYPWATKTSVRRPKDWIAWGGYGGVRLFERMITFEPVVVAADSEGIEFGGATQNDTPK
ncbi:MAG: Verru_Chthon cassette protein A [Verrucomicrobia bacterium]|nr:Verru_Chthon cassette protein A [Verrucomicrobiota bacterium]